MKIFFLIVSKSILLFGIPVLVMAQAHFPLGCYYLDDGIGYPIIDVKGTSPYVMMNGRKTKVDLSRIYFDRLPLFGSGFVDLEKTSGYSVSSNVRAIRTLAGESDAAEAPNRMFIDAEMRFSEDMKNVYAIIFSGSQEAISARDLDELFVTLKSIGKVKSGKLYKETFSGFAINDPKLIRESAYFIAFYDSGMPIHSDFDETVTYHFLQREIASHRLQMKTYLSEHAKASKKHEIVYSFTPYLPKEIYEKVKPVNAKLIIGISDEGYAKLEKVEGLDDAEAVAFINSAVSQWLFLPKLINGKPVASKTAVRLEL